MNCVRDFGNTAGLRINFLKSNIFMAGIDERTRQDILCITGFNQGTLHVRYLGIPIASGKLRTSDYAILVDNLTEKVNAWPRHTLSYAGKLELIRSVLQGVECFLLSILPLPVNIIDRIYGICRNFFWSSKHPPIAWNIVWKPKEDRGLRLKNLVAWNNALIAKTLWKIHKKKKKKR